MNRTSGNSKGLLVSFNVYAEGVIHDAYYVHAFEKHELQLNDPPEKI